MKISKIGFNQNTIVTSRNDVKELNRNSYKTPADYFQLSGLSKTADVSMDNISFKANPNLVKELHMGITELMLCIFRNSTEAAPNDLIVKLFSTPIPNIEPLIELSEKAISMKISDSELPSFFKPLHIAAKLNNYSNVVSEKVLAFSKRYLTDIDCVKRFEAQQCFTEVAINSGKELDTVLEIINQQMKTDYVLIGVDNVKKLLQNAGKYEGNDLQKIHNQTIQALRVGLKGKNSKHKSFIRDAINEHPLTKTHGHMVGNEF